MKIYAITALSDNFQMAFATIFQVVLSYFLNFYRKLARTIVPQIVVRRWLVPLCGSNLQSVALLPKLYNQI